MEDVIVFCNKTVENVSPEISATEFKLNKKLQREEWQAIHKTLKKIDNINRKFFEQKKSKTFDYLEFKPKQSLKPEKFFEKEQNLQEQKSTYASIVQKTSKTNVKHNFSKTTFQSGSSSERPTLSE